LETVIIVIDGQQVTAAVIGAVLTLIAAAIAATALTCAAAGKA
jgi:hypothetical protein